MAQAPNTKQVIIDNLVTTTWYDVRKQVIDQVFGITPVYDKLVQGGRIKSRAPDGTHWEIPIQYGKQDQNRQWFGDSATFGTATKETLTNLMFQIRYCGTNVVRKWVDDNKNRGKAKILDYVDTIVQNTKDALIDGFETDVLTQNSDPLAMTAIPTLLPTDKTSGSVGGLARSDNAFLQHNTIDFTGKDTAVSLLAEMTKMYNLCSLWKSGTRRSPDIVLTTREIYQDYEAIAENLRTIDSNKTERASLGFGDLMFKNVEVFWAPGCASGCMYFINTENIEFSYDPAAWFTMTEWKSPPNGLDRMAQIVCACNLTANNMRKHGVIYNITATST